MVLGKVCRESKEGEQHDAIQTKHGGWKAMLYILVNETFEKMAAYGLVANFTVYLLTVFHLDHVSANLVNIWMGITLFAPLFGAYISDALIGKFKTILFASFASLLGLVMVILTAWIRHLHPPPCNQQQLSLGQCKGPNNLQLAILLIGLGLQSIGAGGIQPCSIPFGVDQFDSTTEKGRKQIASFYNWCYASTTVVVLITLTLLVYIQNNVSWVLGFGIPIILMVFSIVLFFLGRRIYIDRPPEGSVFSGLVQVLVVAYRKRRLSLCTDGRMDHTFYDPPMMKKMSSKLLLTNQLRYLNKAAIIENNDLKSDGSCANPWRLCSIQQVEEAKCLVKSVPIWSTSIICLMTIAQQNTFTISQALKMNRHIGSFQVPAGSITIVSMITVALWLPFYDKVLVPFLQKQTKHQGGITLLQRIGIGLIFSILSMIVSGLVENKRRFFAVLYPNPLGISQVSVFWLSPQLILLGFCETFSIIGLVEFFKREFPENMGSIGNSLCLCAFAIAKFVSSLMILAVHHTTKTDDHPNWLTNDLNEARLDYFYYLLAGMGAVNFLYYLICARGYSYKYIRHVENVDYSSSSSELDLNPV